MVRELFGYIFRAGLVVKTLLPPAAIIDEIGVVRRLGWKLRSGISVAFWFTLIAFDVAKQLDEDEAGALMAVTVTAAEDTLTFGVIFVGKNLLLLVWLEAAMVSCSSAI